MNAVKEVPVKRTLALSILVAVLVLAIAPHELAAQGYVVIHNLVGEDGYSPVSTLVQDSNGFFYGTSKRGGEHGAGTVFKLDANNNFVVLHDFNYVDGSSPQGKLILGPDGVLYGTTDEYGANDVGTIYRLDSDGNNFSVLHDFEFSVAFWDRSLVLDSAGTLFGLTGVSEEVFRIDTDGSNYSVIYPFAPGEGGPTSLMLGADGVLYGTTENPPTAFRIGRDGSDFQTLHIFDDGYPVQRLIEGTDGFLYGAAVTGGEYSNGAAFKLRKDGSSFAVIHDFLIEEGRFPEASLTQVVGGLLYGTATAGGIGGGTIFRMTTAGDLFGVVHDFEDLTGDSPRRAVLQGLDGALYGTTTSGGTGGVSGGVVYRLSIPMIAALSPSSGPAGGGTVVVISGSGFQAGAAVTIGGSLAGAVIGPSAITASTPPLTAGTLNDVVITNPSGTVALYENAWLADFLDVPQSDPFHDFVEQIVRHGITSGCGGGNYCGGASVTRGQMAVFLLKAKHGPNYAPPPCTGAFPDVACPSPFADWIEQLAAENITAGCAGGNFCPGNLVTRAQMAVFLLKTEHGSSYAPPACTGIFGDVACPSPFANWIERLAAEGVTGGCGGGNYCPANPNTRGQMAVFLAKTFGLAP